MTVAGELRGPGDLRGVSCLVLGAGGFIGGNLCRALSRAGARVHGFGRGPAYPDALDGLRFTRGEFSDRGALARAADGADIVFHLLGGSTPDVSNKDPIADLGGNLLPSVQLLETCRAAGVSRVVFVSSGGTVYGVPASVPIGEEAATNPISAYGINKLTVEKYLHLYRYLHGLDYLVFRVANPFGPFQSPYRRQGVVAALTRSILNGRPVEIWGDGQVVRDFLYIGDVVEAMVAGIAYRGPHRVMNLGSGIGRSILDVVRDIGETLGHARVDVVHKPGRAADVPANVLDIGLIRRELGWAPRMTWTDALRDTAAWVKQAHPEP